MEETSTNYNKIIGKKWDTYYFLDDTFKHSDTFKWATGTKMERLTPDEMEKKIDEYDWEELRKGAVQSNWTTQGLDDRVDDMDDEKKQNTVRDDSYANTYGEGWTLGEMLGEWFSDCTWGGRCFDLDMCDQSRRDKIYNPELLDVIREYETSAT